MNLHHLRSFVAVIEHGSISGAARQLLLTPSSVSAHIKSLENEYEIELFARTHRGVELTPTGRLMEQSARRALEAARAFAAQAAASRGRESGSARFAFSVSPKRFDLSQFAADLADQYPGVTLQIARGETAQILDSIRRNRLDLGVVYGTIVDGELHARTIGRAELVIGAPRVWFDSADFSWPRLADLPWINTGDDCPFRALARDLFAAKRINPPERLCSGNDSTRLQLVRDGLGVSLLDRTEADNPDVVVWDAEPLSCSISLATLSHRRFEPVIRAARQLILRLAKLT